MTADFMFFAAILFCLSLISPGPALSTGCEYGPGGDHLSTQIAAGAGLNSFLKGASSYE